MRRAHLSTAAGSGGATRQEAAGPGSYRRVRY